ncbi:MAG: Ig-like domain-containing protein [Deltaproteobacteria bacterium]|nr:Ig-like domain-containing protein [Deltaproteobacteria bacterium]
MRRLCVLFLVLGCSTSSELSLLSVYPPDGADGVALDVRVELAFDRPVEISSDAPLRLLLDDQPLPGEVSLGEGGGPLVFTPQFFLLAGRRYAVELDAGGLRDLQGRPWERAQRWQFTTIAGCEMRSNAAARHPAGAVDETTAVIPGGRRITPPGRQVHLGSLPTNLVAWPDRPLVLTTDNGWGTGNKIQSLSLVDCARAERLQTVERQSPQALFYGLALSSDGSRIYAAGGANDRVEVFDFQPDPPQLVLASELPVEGYPGGLLLDEQRGLLYVAAHLAGDIAAVDLETGEERFRTDVGKMPYDIERSADGRKLYVSLWARIFIGDPGQVVVLDAEDGAVLARIDVGKNPEDLVLASDGRLFVACSDSDRVDVIDTRTDELAASWPVREPAEPVGQSPVALCLDEARQRLYVACAQKNSVDALSLADGRRLGSVPSAWYPTGVALGPGGDTLYVLNGKGVGSGPNVEHVYVASKMHGTLSITPVPSDAELRAGAQQVHDNNTAPLGFFPDRCLGKSFPLPRALGEPSPIKHVVFVLRENKTYDENLGDLEHTDGDPSLTMFGEHNTPNLHALAREFCNLDNFHAEIEVSVQGHYWNVTATINDYSEKVWHAGYRDKTRIPSTGAQQPDYPAGGFLWHALEGAGIDFRDYGEPVGLASEYERFGEHVNMDYMIDLLEFQYLRPDVERVDMFWEEVEAGIFPAFVFLSLLNDHTYGSRAGVPTPQWMVAENDYATGLLIDRLSHSEHWPETLVIITEDDPQGGADHVDNHRTIALLVSPYTRKGITSSVHYGFSSLIRTYGLILGMPALNLLDETSSPVYDCFTSQPDFTPYDVREMEIPYQENAYHTPGALESERMDFSAPDRAAGLGSVLWMATRPGEPLPPQLLVDPIEDDDLEPRWELPIPLGLEPATERKADR